MPQVTAFTFEMPVTLKNKLLEIAFKRKMQGVKNATIKAVIVECLEKGIKEIETYEAG